MRRHYNVVASAALAIALWPTVTGAQGFPQRPVRVIVPFSTGTAADIVARHLGSRLAEAWGQGVVIENQGGAGGVIGAAAVAKTAPDGHTSLMAGINQAINPSLYKDMPFDTLRDFNAIVRVALAPLAIAAHPGFAANSVPELIASARTPGDVIAKIHGDVAKIAQSKAFIDLLQALEIDLLPPAEFRAFLASELGPWSMLVKDSGAKLD